MRFNDLIIFNKTKVAMIIFSIFILLLIAVPFLVIWAINTLFALSIPFAFDTWLAVLVLFIIGKTNFITK